MALPKLEAFTDTNGTSITAHDANWKNARTNGALEVQSNGLVGSPGTSYFSIFYWDGDTPANAQYSQVKAVVLAAVGWIGSGVRVGASTAYNGYVTESLNGDRYIESIVAGAVSTLFNDVGAVAVNDVLRLEASGNQLTYKINGSTITTVTDNTFAGPGRLGVNIYGTTASRLDDWEGGNLSVPGGNSPYNPWLQRMPLLAQP